MSIQNEITRLQNAKNKIKAKAVALGIADNNAKLDVLANAIDSIIDNGSISKTLDTNTTSYTVTKGYHSGEGIVKIVTEEKEATPTTTTQNITPSDGKALSKVTVTPIPSNYITTDDADAVAANILIDKTAYVNGTKLVGTMPNNGTVRYS